MLVFFRPIQKYTNQSVWGGRTHDLSHHSWYSAELPWDGHWGRRDKPLQAAHPEFILQLVQLKSCWLLALVSFTDINPIATKTARLSFVLGGVKVKLLQITF